MKLREKRPPTTRALAAYLEGELTASDTRKLEVQIEESRGALQRLDELRAIRDAVASPVPELEHIDLRAAVRERITAARQESSARRGRWQIFAAPVVAAAACVALVALWDRTDNAGDEFRRKAARSGSGVIESSTNIHVYVTRDAALPLPLLDSIDRHAGLLFAYENAAPRPYPYLMVFAVDARGDVRWFYPAFERAGTDPISIRIAGQRKQTLLPDVIEHDFTAGPMVLYAVFTREALRVSEVERWLHDPRRALASPAPGAVLHSIALTVR